MKPKYFNLFSSCILVNGFVSSSIYDLDNGQIFPIPNQLYSVLERSKKNTITSIKNYFNRCNDKGIDAYFGLLNEKRIGFYTNTPDEFPVLDLKWESPCEIKNAILEYSNNSNYSLKNAIIQLNGLGCEAIQIRFIEEITLEVMFSNLLPIVNSRIKYLELFLPYSSNTTIEDLKKIRLFDPRITKIIQYNSPGNTTVNIDESYYNSVFFQIKNHIDSNSKEIISPRNMVCNIDTFSEAQTYNVGLNKKISIDNKGFFRNYLNHKASYGNINTTEIINIIQDENFKKKGEINNNSIEKCKICQYRYGCISNSDILSKDNKYYKQTDCDFNPEKNIWKDY